MVIKEGDLFLCIKDVTMHSDGRKEYIKGNIYKSEQKGCITNESGDIGHEWDGVEYLREYFIKGSNDIIMEKETGIKNDSDKLPYYTVLFKQFPLALKEVIKCSQAGNKKYFDTDKDFQNFSRVPNSNTRYKNALLRHLSEEGIVEDMKEYGEMTHEGAVVWNALADLEIKLRQNENN